MVSPHLTECFKEAEYNEANVNWFFFNIDSFFATNDKGRYKSIYWYEVQNVKLDLFYSFILESLIITF